MDKPVTLANLREELDDLLERSRNDGRVFSTSIPITTIETIIAALEAAGEMVGDKRTMGAVQVMVPCLVPDKNSTSGERIALVPAAPASPGVTDFQLGDRVEKRSGAKWRGKVVGFYSTQLTREGYAVESENEPGSVQIYPRAAIAALSAAPPDVVEVARKRAQHYANLLNSGTLTENDRLIYSHRANEAKEIADAIAAIGRT